ncbi:prepilin peptidase [Endozoicomonadaceae bacterium StTr2]
MPLELLAQNTTFFLGCVFILGLMVGSFLNVVVWRLPIMMDRQCKTECREILELPPEAEDGTYNLILPASTCPHCEHKIRPWENIPVISYLFLRGRCSQCKKGISPRYPIVELATALISLLVASHFGYGLQTLLVLGLSWCLIALTLIDFDHQLLPDDITLPLIWAGLIINSFGIFTSLESALWGAVAGYLSLWSVYWLFKWATKKEGMGYGDFKLLAALGAWMGWQVLPMVILMSSFVGAFIGIMLVLFKGRDHNLPIPFGPYLAAAGFIVLLWGDKLAAQYLRLMAF